MQALVEEFNMPLLYSGEPPELKVSVNCNRCTHREVLKSVFKDISVGWEWVDGHYLVTFSDFGAGKIVGKINLEDRKASLNGIMIVFNSQTNPDIRLRAITDKNGEFELDRVPPDVYLASMKALGFESQNLGKVQIVRHEIKKFNTEVSMMALPPDELTVTPGNYQLIGEDPELTKYRTREQMDLVPNLANDIMRTMAILPGAYQDGISARPRSSSSLNQSIQIQLDGMLLRDPFHVKELNGVISSIDRDTVSHLEWTSGGYTAEHGNILGGLISLSSTVPLEDKTEVGISTSHARFVKQGVFAEGQGHYFVSARAGLLRYLIDMVEHQEFDNDGDSVGLDPGYYDQYSKLRYVLSPSHAISAHGFISNDVVSYGDNFRDGRGVYVDQAIWVNLDSNWGDGLSAQTHVSWDGYEEDQNVENLDDGASVLLKDLRDTDSFRLGQNWNLSLPNLSFRAGWYFKSERADYDYRHSVNIGKTIELINPGLPNTADKIVLTGEAYEAFAAIRFRAHEKVIVEVGGRYDYQSWNRTNQWSPRINLAWFPAPRTKFSLAVGKYYQPKQLNELQIADGQTSFETPEFAHHFLMGIQHQWSNGVRGRIEFFSKPGYRPGTRYENIWTAPTLLAELAIDRLRIEADRSENKGIALSLDGDFKGGFSWLANYAWSDAFDWVDGVKIPRRFSQKHTVNLNLSKRLSKRWHSHLSWSYHSGWRTTTAQVIEGQNSFELDLGPYNGFQLPAQHRMDLRFNRTAPAKRGFSWHIDIINLLNRKNIRGFGGELDEMGIFSFEPDYGLPLIASFGINWSRKK